MRSITSLRSNFTAKQLHFPLRENFILYGVACDQVDFFRFSRFVFLGE